MADLKVSDFTAASTLSGSDLLYAVQGSGAGAQKKATVAQVDDFIEATAHTFTKPQTAGQSSLTHNTSWDGTDKQRWLATVNGSSFTIANPTSATTNTGYIIKVSYTTTHSISWGSAFKGLTGITPTATAGKIDYFFFDYDGTNMNLTGYRLDSGS